MASVSHPQLGLEAEISAIGNSKSYLARAGRGLVHLSDSDVQALRFLRLALVLQRIDIGRTTWLEGVKSGMYPPPIQVSHRNRWISYEIDALQDAMIRGETGDLLRITVSELMSQRKHSFTM